MNLSDPLTGILLAVALIFLHDWFDRQLNPYERR